MKQLQGIDLSKDSGRYNTTIIAPPTQGVQVAPRSMLIYSLTVFFGMVVGFGLALCAEFSEKTYRSAEAVSGLGLPVLGQIPLFRLLKQPGGRTESDECDLAPILCAHQRPDSLEAEAYRGLRTALYASPCGQGNQIIQITSPNSNDGKTTLAANLAVSIAQSGKRVLLVDTDLRQGEINSIFRLSNSQGLADILADQAESCDVIQSTRIAGLEVLPTGPFPRVQATCLAPGG